MDITNKLHSLGLFKYISEEQFFKNFTKAQDLQAYFLTHKVFSNYLLDLKNLFNISVVPLETAFQIHFDYRHAIVQIFTDALLAAAQSSSQLETVYNLPPGSKIIPRIFLSPNFLDEFGFNIKNNSLIPSISSAHYPLFENIFKNFESRPFTLYNSISEDLKNYLEFSYNSFPKIVVLLAVAELQVIHFTPVLKYLLDVNNIHSNLEYYNVHGSSQNPNSNACDDEHAEDLLICLSLIINKVDIEDLKVFVDKYLDLWDIFWKKQTNILLNNPNPA